MTLKEFEHTITCKHSPVLDKGFVPAWAWNRAYDKLVAEDSAAHDLAIALQQPNGSISVFRTRMLPEVAQYAEINLRFVERLVKFLLWSRGGSRVVITGAPQATAQIQAMYTDGGEQAFDAQFIGGKIYREPLVVEACGADEFPQEKASRVASGGSVDGCRLGFDLGGSDRKAAALIDGEVVFSEEITWDPYFESDPNYHLEGILDSLRRAAKHLPRVDAIGGSAAGAYVDNEPRAGSLFRGVSESDFDEWVRPIFKKVAAEWNVPISIANDGDVSALAAAQMLGQDCKGGVLGVALGTSFAVGYVGADGHLLPWLNELAFVPVDYRSEGGYVDEWTGDAGTGVRYHSQQALLQLESASGLDLGGDAVALPKRLVALQAAMERGDEKAAQIYQCYGVYLGYSVAYFATFYPIRHLCVLGRVLSGAGGEQILAVARQVLDDECPELSAQIEFANPDEKFKRHGQAIAAASLPEIHH